MKRSLTLAMRPKTLDAMVGQERLVKEIRERFKRKRIPPAWLFIGEKGAGKTTIARIMSRSLQCTHQSVFGNPCKACQRSHAFNIVEINAGDIRGIDDLRSAVQAWDYEPGPGSRYRVYILDEAQGMTKDAHRLMLKYLEDGPSTTVYMLCTTDPNKIPETIQSRCVVKVVPSLNLKGVRKLVRKALRFSHSDFASDPLIDALNEAEVTSPRNVVKAVEAYLDGATPEEAAKVQAVTEIDTHRICRALIKGMWPDVAKLLRQATPAESFAIQASVTGYLRSILLDEIDFSARAMVVSNGISELLALTAFDDKMRFAGIANVLFRLCKKFRCYKR